jgi:polar amino acid transport system permease protein
MPFINIFKVNMAAYFERINFSTLIVTMFKSCGVSLEVFFLTLLFSLPLALLIAFGRMSKFKPLAILTNVLMLIIRGTPLMLQLIFVYFAPPLFFKALGYSGNLPGFDRFTAAIVAMSINYACYFAEIYRGGIQSIPAGQYEAAKILGFTGNQTFFRIILPQVVKRILPAMGNEVITLVKDTALVQVLGVAELFHVAQTQSGRLVSTMPLFIAGVFYFIMNYLVAKVFAVAEDKLNYYK